MNEFLDEDKKWTLKYPRIFYVIIYVLNYNPTLRLHDCSRTYQHRRRKFKVIEYLPVRLLIHKYKLYMSRINSIFRFCKILYKVSRHRYS